MNRAELKVIVGGADPYRRSKKRKYISGFVTNSRLMGVLVIYLQWELPPVGNTAQDSARFHQFFYIETTEAGIESYRSLYGNDAMAIMEMEQAMLGGLGAEKVEITKKEASILLRGYSQINKRFDAGLPGRTEEYESLLSGPVNAVPEEDAQLFGKTCLPIENNIQLINYFLIRYFAGDMPAVNFLTKPNMALPLSTTGLSDTLCMNRIQLRQEGSETSYICESLVESDSGHRIVQSEMRADDMKVSSFEIIGGFQITAIEAAMKLERPEFIIVYGTLMDAERIIDALDEKYPAAMKRDTDEGKLYINFKENNDHVKGKVYRLNDDIRGMIYVTNENQLILSAWSISLINKLEREIRALPFGKLLRPIAKYEFKEDVFYDFIRSDCEDFIRFIEYLYDIDPENDE